MIPYWQVPQWTLPQWLPEAYQGRPLDPFGPLVLLGVILGVFQCRRFAKARGLDLHAATAAMFFAVLIGFFSAHVVSVLFYSDQSVASDPWELLRVWNGLSSMGGFFGGGLAAAAILYRKKIPILPYIDMLTFGMLIGWCGGRLGCSFVHDHPGMILSAHWPAIIGPWPDGTFRYDLGVLELIPTVLVTVFVYGFSRWRAWPDGRMFGSMILIYCPTRFAMDFLRAVEAAPGITQFPDTRHLGLTMAQWSAFVLVPAGVMLLYRGRGREAHKDPVLGQEA